MLLKKGLKAESVSRETLLYQGKEVARMQVSVFHVKHSDLALRKAVFLIKGNVPRETSRKPEIPGKSLHEEKCFT